MIAYCMPAGILTLANAPPAMMLEVRGVVGRELHSCTLLPGTLIQVIGRDGSGVRVQLTDGSLRVIDPRLAPLIRVETAGWTAAGGSAGLTA
jgi:hypothetical protein